MHRKNHLKLGRGGERKLPRVVLKSFSNIRENTGPRRGYLEQRT